MKTSTLHRVLLLFLALSLLFGVGLYWGYRADLNNHRNNYNLYALVPADASMVVEVSDVTSFVKQDGLSELRKSNELPVTPLFDYVANYLRGVVEALPHGLSLQMNTMALSHHNLSGGTDEVLYLSVGESDVSFVQGFVEAFSSPTKVPAVLEHEGRQIVVYSMLDGRTMAVCRFGNLLAVSFNLDLIEQVVHAQQDREVLDRNDAFNRSHRKAFSWFNVTVFTRTGGDWATRYVF